MSDLGTATASAQISTPELQAALERVETLTRQVAALEARLQRRTSRPGTLPCHTFQALRFTVADAPQVMEAERIEEIIRVALLARIRSDDGAVLGILDFHGSPVPIIDVGARFGWGRTPWTENTPIIVLRAHGRRIGLLVTSVSHLIDIAPSHRRSVDETARADVSVVALAEVEETLVPVIDPELLVTDDLRTEFETLVEDQTPEVRAVPSRGPE